MDAQKLHGLIRRAQARWPAIAPPVQLEAQLRRALPDDHEAAREWLTRGPSDDLYLATACLEGSAAALTAFESELIVRIGEYIQQLRPTADFIDEVKQRVRERLFVGGSDGRPRIADYTAKGPLSAWLRVVSMRVALQLRRQSRAPSTASSEDELAQLPTPTDPESLYVRRRYGVLMECALKRAFATLPPEQSALLRMHFIEGMTFDELAARFAQHKVTLWRRMVAARNAVIDAARAILRQEAAISPGEFDSIHRALRSQLHLSISARGVTIASE